MEGENGPFGFRSEAYYLSRILEADPDIGFHDLSGVDTSERMVNPRTGEVARYTHSDLLSQLMSGFVFVLSGISTDDYTAYTQLAGREQDESLTLLLRRVTDNISLVIEGEGNARDIDHIVGQFESLTLNPMDPTTHKIRGLVGVLRYIGERLRQFR